VTLEYAARGLVGVLTPQANTTVEPELHALWPAGVAMIAARMTSARPTIEERLIDYYQRLDETVQQFGNAPLRVLASACTGSSYLIGAEREDALFGTLSQRLGIPVTNSALAVVAALQALGARRVGLVSPYPANLTERSVAYWRSRGLEVLQVAATEAPPGEAFHPIYALSADATAQAIGTLQGTAGLQAVVLLGTGTPTLGAVANHPQVDGVPVFSCNMALAWHSVALMAAGQPPQAADLLAMVRGEGWRDTLLRRQAAS
jgi:maleate isomerase